MNRPQLTGLAALMVVAGAAILWWLWPTHPELSQEAYQYVMALDSACSRKDAPTIERLAGMIEESLQQKKLEDAEIRSLTKLLKLAQSKDWDRARQACRSLLEAQQNRVSATES